jgi:ERCC4-related helicase
MKELSLKPREYQEKIFQTAKEKNTLVVLPTGTGKTLIAIMLSIEVFKKNPLKKILLLAPTRPLIEQHINSFREKIPENWADLQLFTGKTNSKIRKDIWKTAEIIFSTPQCIANDLDKNLYDLSEVSLLIVDEAHRCLKNYAYNNVAKKYILQSKKPKILALTASPGSDMAKIKEICQNLSIEELEIRTRDSPDVKPYLQELEFEKIEVDFPPSLFEIKILLDEIYNELIEKLKERKIIFSQINKTQLLILQSKIIRDLRTEKNGNKMQASSIIAQALKISHAIELIETQTVNSFVEYLRELYKQAHEKRSRGVQKLTKDKRFTKAYILATQQNKEHPKIEELYNQVKKQIEKNNQSKIIVFAQFRETVRTIKEYLNKISGINADLFVGQAQKENTRGHKTGLKQKEQKEMINKFKRGDINVLVATSIAEEGLDIPEVSMVIFYEPIPSAIRKIQRAGRTARLSPGQLKILLTKNTRDQVYYYASFHKEKRMYKAIDQIKEDFNKTNIQNNQKEEQKKLF